MSQSVYEGAPRVDPDAEFDNLPEPRTALEMMLAILLREGGSDLHLHADEHPRFRRDGDLIQIPDSSDLTQPLRINSRALVVRIVEILLSGQQLAWFERADAVARERLDHSAANEQRRIDVMERYEKQGVDVRTDPIGFDVDCAYEYGDAARFRVNISFDRGNPRVVMRKIPTKILTMDELSLPETLLELATLQRGLVLVTGPTGSGKSTTLAAIIDHINATRAVSILTVEDPIEFVHRSQKAMVAQREIGEDTPSFAEALKRALRQDPDVILVGEMRDLETMRIALEAAETGHLVFGTMHTKSAKDTLTRIVNQYPTAEQAQVKMTLVGSLQAVVGQTLLKRRGSGRVAGLEIMKVNTTIRAQMSSPSGFQQIEDTIRGTGQLGNMLLDDHLYDLVVRQRLVDATEAAMVANDRLVLVERLTEAGYAPNL